MQRTRDTPGGAGAVKDHQQPISQALDHLPATHLRHVSLHPVQELAPAPHGLGELGGTVAGPQQMYRSLPAGYPPIFGEVRIGQR